jgi:ABC-2 type transport system permease protein
VTLTDTRRGPRRLPVPGSAVFLFTGRRSVASGVLWGFIFGLYVAVQTLGYATTYKTVAARRVLAKEFGSNPGISALVGPAHDIATVAGFAAWKCLTVLAIIGAVWGVFTGTRLLRGEEDAGRWELLLSGAISRRGAATEALCGLALGGAALLVVTAEILVIVGRSSKVGFSVGASCYFALAIVSGAIMFLVVGALASQLCATRRQASGYAAGLLGACYAVRMVADSGTGLAWLRWGTPFGWIEQLRPLTTPNPWALLPIGAWTVVVAALSVAVAARRDVGAGLLADRSRAVAHLRLVSGPVGLALRLTRPTLLAWAASIIAYGLVLGSIARSGGRIFTSSPSLRLFFSRLGVTGAQAYLGFALLIMAMALSFMAAGQIAAARTEESTGRLENLLVRPFSRTSWLSQRLLLALVVLLGGGLLAALSTWAGAASAHADVSIASMIGAGLNVVPQALLLLGIGALTLALWPRAAMRVVYGALVWSLFVELIGSALNMNHWLLDTSALHQMAPAPAVGVDWGSAAVMVALGVAAALLGLFLFVRRDLKGE